MSQRKHLVPILLAAAATLPGLYVRFAHVELPAPILALTAGLAILGASFLLLWACDAAQADISQTLAIAVVALIAVLPEYAVDMYFTWQAGRDPQGNYAQFAIANMTGANRLLIGGAWTLIAVIFWFRTRRAVVIESDRRLELLFLGMATLYAFLIPLKGSLAWYDGLVFLGLYVWYIGLAARRPCAECEAGGPADLLLALPTRLRRISTAGLFSVAAIAIALNAEPFSEGLIGTGTVLHVNRFVLVQWLAPVASEAPEFIVAVMFALRGRAGLALGSLLSAKLNQWTLLVGMIPGVYAASHGTLAHPIPMNSFQMHEILLTAAQSLLAVVILSPLRLTIGQAMLLLGLFIGQFIAPSLVAAYPGLLPIKLDGEQVHELFALLYVVAAITLLLDHPRRVMDLPLALKPEEEEADSEERTLARI